MQCSVFAPSHITGFFEIKKHNDPILSGSRGAGVALDNGVETFVELKEGDGDIHISLNNLPPQDGNSITNTTIKILHHRFPDDFQIQEKDLVINHTTKAPVGAGFGISAACALGTSIGLSKLLELPLTFNQAASFAHHAEIELGSGLGDVIAEVHGGMVLRLKEGAPDTGRVDKIIGEPLKEPLYVISRTLGEIETSDIINNQKYIDQINIAGSLLLHKLLKNPNPHEFMRLSRKFAEKTGLMDDEVREIVEVMQEESIGASMAMLGRTAFALADSPDTSIEHALVSSIDNCGCRFF
jgi:pantoate kinase